MKPKIYLKIFKIGIIFSLFFVLFRFRDLLYPYISSKQLPFNILMELLLPFWVVFIWRYKSYRPKKNLVLYGLVAYFLVIFISAIFGVDFNLSFWGDTERMLGFFHILHFLIFYLILITAFKSEKDWKLLLNSSLIVATLVSLIGLLGDNPYSTIGNTTYVSGYLIFNFFFAAILFFRERKSWRYIYLLPFIIMLLEFKNMRTSGAIIGLAVGVFLSIVLIALLSRKKKLKITLLSLCLLLATTVIFIFSNQSADWFQNSFLRNLTTQKTTFQTRLFSWKAAWQDFPEHPVLGTGFGNFAIIFDKHFDPEFFNYDKNETYFDRAHNNLIDIASTTGILGLITYLSILVFVFYYLIKIWKRNGRRIDETPLGRQNLELTLITGLLLAYFVQNLAVFDSFVTYLGLMMVLGLVYFIYQNSEDNLENEETQSLSDGKEKSLLIILLLLVLIPIFSFNVRQWKMLKGSIVAYSQIVNKDIVNGFDTIENTFSDSPFERDPRSSIVTLVASNPIILSSLETKLAIEKFNFLKDLAEKNLTYNEKDNLLLLQAAQLYDTGARVFYDDESLRNDYAQKSLEYSERAIESSPGRIPVYFSKSQALSVLGNNDEALNTLLYAKDLNPDFSDTYCRLGMKYYDLEKLDQAYEDYSVCIDGGSVNKIGGVNSLINVAVFMAERQDYERSIVVLERVVEIYDTDANMWLNLAKLYLVTGASSEKVRLAANKALQLDPSLQAEINSILSNL